MARQKKASNGAGSSNGATLDFEAKLWQTADALRNNMDAAEYKHVVLGLIFLKYISDAFEAKHAELASQRKHGADPEDPDEYRAASIFWVPKEARWSHLKASAPAPKARRAGSSTRPRTWSASWSKCSPPIRAGCTTLAAAPGACS